MLSDGGWDAFISIATVVWTCYPHPLLVEISRPRDAPVTSSPGYDGSPIAKKIGFKPGMTVCALNVPEHYGDLLIDLPDDVVWAKDLDSPRDLVHVFVTKQDRLTRILPKASRAIRPDGILWISWPKRASKIPTNLTRAVVQDLCQPFGLAAAKGCIVDADWSALKFQIRKEPP